MWKLTLGYGSWFPTSLVANKKTGPNLGIGAGEFGQLCMCIVCIAMPIRSRVLVHLGTLPQPFTTLSESHQNQFKSLPTQQMNGGEG